MGGCHFISLYRKTDLYWFQPALSRNKCKGSYSFCCLTRHKEVCSVADFPCWLQTISVTPLKAELRRHVNNGLLWAIVSLCQHTTVSRPSRPATRWWITASWPNESSCPSNEVHQFPQAEDYNWAHIGVLSIFLYCSWRTISLQEELATSRKEGSFFPNYNKKCTWKFNKCGKINHSLRADNKNSCPVLHQPSTVLRNSFHSPPSPVMKPLSSPLYKW